jgi:glycine oxidase
MAAVGWLGGFLMDAIVIGGGVIGLAIARRLAKEGLEIALLERGVCGAEASWAAAGVLAPPNPHRNDAAAEAHRWSLSLYPQFCAELVSETGINPEYDPCGELELLLTSDSLSIAQSDEAAGRRFPMPDGSPSYAIRDAWKTRDFEPAATQTLVASLECRATAQVRNPRLSRALKASCLQAGVEVREGATVDALISEGDRVAGVYTGAESLHARWTILAAGAWSSKLDARLERLMPVFPVRGQMILLKADSQPFKRVFSRGKVYVVPRRDGHILVGSTEEPEAGFVKRTTAAGVARLLSSAVQLVPGLAHLPVTAMWSGLRPCTPDERPYIGPVPGMNGLIAATGHYRSGLSLAPATAEIVTGIVTSSSLPFDPASCRPGR